MKPEISHLKFVQAVPKMGGVMPGCQAVGRKGMPAHFVHQMYQDYLRLRSLAKTGALHGRTRQSIYDIFRRRGLKLFAKEFKKRVVFKGRKYTPDTQGYLRDTVARKPTYFLHRIKWEKRFGPVPRGHDVGFRDGNKFNVRIENLICLPRSEMVRRNATGRNGATHVAAARTTILLNRFNRRAQ